MKLKTMGMVFGVMLLSMTSVNAGERIWTDVISGREYVFLDHKQNWESSEAECRQKGYALLDLRFLKPEEQTELLKSPLITELPYEKKYVGTSREVELASLWQSHKIDTRITTPSSVSFSVPQATQMLIQRKAGKLSIAREFRGASSHKTNAICMSVENFWHRCESWITCKTHNITMEHKITDFGGTRNEAVQRIVELAQHPDYASGFTCSIDMVGMTCNRLLP